MLSNGQNAGGLSLFCALLLYSAMGWAQGPALSVPLSARFTVPRFGEQLGLGVVTVTTMAQDRQGFLWIGTQTGLFRYDGARVQKWPEVDKIAGHYIDQILIAPDETVWVKGTVGVGYYANRRFEAFPLPAGVKPTGISQSLAIDKARNLFLAADQGFLPAELPDP